MYKEFIKPNTKKPHNPIKKWAKDLNKHFSEEDIQMANKIYEKMSNGTIHQKNAMRYHLTPVSMAIINKSTSAREAVKKGEPFCSVGGNADWCSHCGK